jgi:hypothetical protein
MKIGLGFAAAIYGGFRKKDRVLFTSFVRWDFGYRGHSWPIVPALGDSKDDCGEADGM